MKIKIVNKTKFELPKYETNGSVGMDLRADLENYGKNNDFKIFYVEDDADEFFYGEVKYHIGKDENLTYSDGLWLRPHKQYIIPTGIFTQLPTPQIEIASGEGSGYEAQIRPRSGLAAKHGITIVNSPGTIDCFSEDSTIKTPNGEVKIDEMKIGDIVLSTNEDTLEVEKDIVDAIVDTGIQDVLVIETDDGVLKITPNTIIYTDNGVKNANELNIGDNILFFE
jgi:dUTPase